MDDTDLAQIEPKGPSVQDLGSIIELAYFNEEGGWREDLEDAMAEDIEARGHMLPLWDVRQKLAAVEKACKLVRAYAEEQIAKQLGPGGRVRLDDYLVSVKADEKMKCTDPEGLREWLGDKAFDAFNPNDARKTSLRGIAAEREEDPDGPLDSFYEIKAGEPKLATQPVDKGPKYAAEMKHGETRGALS